MQQVLTAANNLEAVLRGTSKPEQIVVIGAHYDSALHCPAANDNGSGVAAGSWVTCGISTNCSSRFGAVASISGGPSTRTATSSTSSCSHAGTAKPRSASSGGY